MLPSNFSKTPLGLALSVFGIPESTLLFRRTVATVCIGIKFFFASFFWEGAGILGETAFGLSEYDAGYFFLTGFGTIIGITVGELILFFMSCAFQSYTIDELYTELHFHILLCFGAGLTAGTLWQVNVNIGLFLGFDFTEAFFFMLAMSFLVFVIAVSTFRECNALLPGKVRLRLQKSEEKLWYDTTLGLAVAAADAFFVGTDNDEYTPNGWLGVFAVGDSTSTIAAMSLAGASSLTGFLIVQTVMNCCLVDVWIDGYKPNLHPQATFEDFMEERRRYSSVFERPVETTALVSSVPEAEALVAGE